MVADDPSIRARRSCRPGWRPLEQEEAAIQARGTVAHVMHERTEPAMAYILYRGEYDKRRDPVKPDTPDVLPPMPPRPARATGSAWRSGCSGPSTR